MVVDGTLFIKVTQAFEHFESGVDGAVGMMAHPRHILEDGHQAITNVFVNMAVVANDNIGHQGEIVIQGLGHFLELGMRGVGSKIHDVRHQNSQYLTLPAEEKRP